MVKLRLRVLNDTMTEMFEYLRDNGQVGILDGSNTSHWIREYITKQIEKEVGLGVLSYPAQRPRSPVDRDADERQFHSGASFPARETLLHRVHGLRPRPRHERLREPRRLPDDKVESLASSDAATTTSRTRRRTPTASRRSTRTTASVTSPTTSEATCRRRSSPS